MSTCTPVHRKLWNGRRSHLPWGRKIHREVSCLLTSTGRLSANRITKRVRRICTGQSERRIDERLTLSLGTRCSSCLHCVASCALSTCSSIFRCHQSRDL